MKSDGRMLELSAAFKWKRYRYLEGLWVHSIFLFKFFGFFFQLFQLRLCFLYFGLYLGQFLVFSSHQLCCFCFYPVDFFCTLGFHVGNGFGFIFAGERNGRRRFLPGFLDALGGFFLRGANFIRRFFARFSGFIGVLRAFVGGILARCGDLFCSIFAGIGYFLPGALLGIGNIVGSNTANLTVVLGIAAMIGVVRVDSEIVRREALLMLGSCVLVALLAWRKLTLVGGLILLVGLAGYLALTAVQARRSRNDRLTADVEEYTEKERRYPIWMEVGRTLIGLVGTVAAARALVIGAVGLADRFGLSSGFVGLSIVALGTSLPELAAAVQAVRRKEDELLLGNLVGSNLLNSLLVGGLVGVVGQGVEVTSAVVHRGMVVMLLSVAVVTVLMVTRARIGRAAGVALASAYVVSVAVLAQG